ncbi:MAG: 30S ribosomal protein S1 [Bacteroidales bacterium]|nr:30S ribosomal protein S1 [Bacteroidales bacterium]MDD3011111.1 30S ribosomal protein S1 [Bacteroidales bacterium]MDD3962273.1 30S ribosomal protein S1 [Bacteroidales bacterium]
MAEELDNVAQNDENIANETPEIQEVKTQPEVQEETPNRPDFDWDSVGKKKELYSENERTKLEDLYEKTLNQVAEHEVVEGTVVGKTSREVVINIGFKSDGIVPVNEFRYNPNLKTGDTVEVYVESQEDPNGQLLLSHKKARVLKSWERINTAHDNDEIINGYVKCRTKGGLIVDVFGIEAFLPGSQIDVKPIRDYDIFVDKTMEFKVVKINQEYKNVVVSHKALIEDELEAQKADIIAKLEKGQVLEGTVKNITSYGVFIDLGGVDGLIHITDLSWGRINHPEEIVTLDEKIKVVILDFDENKKRIALGLKQLTPHPWDALDENLKVGDKVSGKVVVIADYGSFIEIAAGVEGLIHVSEMSWSQHLRTAQDFMNVGDEVEAVILTLDREARKMSLGIKQLIPDPWTNIATKYPVHSKHNAIVRNFTNFGIFVELEEGVDGLIHISDLSWSKKIKHPAEFTKIGENIEVIVLDVDVENRRLSLGHKQLEENPWDVFESVFIVGSVHKGTVNAINDKGMVITLPYGVEGFCPSRHTQKEDGSNLRADETVDFKVIEFNKEGKKIILSHSRISQDAVMAEKAKEFEMKTTKERSARKTIKKINDGMEKTTLGDLEALASLKSDMEKEEKAVKAEKAEKAKAILQAKEDAKEKATANDEDQPEEVEDVAEESSDAMDVTETPETPVSTVEAENVESTEEVTPEADDEEEKEKTPESEA